MKKRQVRKYLAATTSGSEAPVYRMERSSIASGLTTITPASATARP
jgi:hypothetical protein